MNGRPVFMRGPVDECVYPLTGYPPTDKASWLRVLGICKSHGFNFLRFHSWCPPEAAFVASADSEMPGNEARNAIDGNPATIWHTPWGGGATAFPHSITVELGQPHTLMACAILPRQDVEPNGLIKTFEVYASNDGRNWGKPVAKGEFAPDRELKRVVFPRPVAAKFLKLVARSGFDAQPFASIAEFDVEQ